MLAHSSSAFILSMFGLTLTLQTTYGQATKQATPFPSYQQIKSNQSEIIDQVSPHRQRPSIGSDQESTTKLFPFNLYDYPSGTVTYYLNDQPTTDVKYVKKVLANTSISVETISIEPPTEDGKRTIRIKYEAR